MLFFINIKSKWHLGKLLTLAVTNSILILKSKWHLGKLLTLAVTNSWPIRQLDVNNAFL
jgi:hypothetical protein